MSEENKTIVVSDFDGLDGADEVVVLSEGRYQLMGLGDIWGLIGNLLKLNLIEHARTLYDMLLANPDKYTVAALIAQIKKAIADISGKQQTVPVGPPKIPAAFALAANSTEVRSIRDELIKRGVKPGSITLPLIFAVAQLLIRYGPDIWDKIMDLIKGKSDQEKPKVKGSTAAATVLALISLFLFAGNGYAQVNAVKSLPASYLAEPSEYLPEPAETEEPVRSSKDGCDDALDEVNAERARRGLPAFQRDQKLTEAARACARERASRLCAGHLPGDLGDFAHLSPSVSTDGVAAGCGALEDSWGWGTCCTYDSYTHAGAAWVRGADGKRYMHLFVSQGNNRAQTRVEPLPTADPGVCVGGTCGTSRRWSPGGIITRGRRGR